MNKLKSYCILSVAVYTMVLVTSCESVLKVGRCINSLRDRAILPFRLERGFVICGLSLTAGEGRDWGALGAAEARCRHSLLDILPPLGKGHHLFTAIAFQFPRPIGRSHLNFVTECLNFAREFGAIDGRTDGLGSVNLDGVKPTPLAVWPPG